MAFPPSPFDVLTLVRDVIDHRHVCRGRAGLRREVNLAVERVVTDDWRAITAEGDVVVGVEVPEHVALNDRVIGTIVVPDAATESSWK